MVKKSKNNITKKGGYQYRSQITQPTQPTPYNQLRRIEEYKKKEEEYKRREEEYKRREIESKKKEEEYKKAIEKDKKEEEKISNIIEKINNLSSNQNYENIRVQIGILKILINNINNDNRKKDLINMLNNISISLAEKFKKKPNLLHNLKQIFKKKGGKIKKNSKYMINPKTGRKILKNGQTAKKIMKNYI